MEPRYSVFATLGNARHPFDRFLRMVDEAAARTGLSTLIQTGNTPYTPVCADAVEFVPRPRFEELMRSADHIITHAGAGSVMTALSFGKVPVVVTRLGSLGEMVNDHQLQLAQELSRLGWCRVASGVDDLVAFLENPQAGAIPFQQISNQRMLDVLTDLVR